MSDLTKQAHEAMDRLIAEHGIWIDNDAQAAARLMWLDGFEAGTKAAKAAADKAFEDWKRTPINGVSQVTT